MARIQRLVGVNAPSISNTTEPVILVYLMPVHGVDHLNVGVGMFLPPAVWESPDRATWDGWARRRDAVMNTDGMRILDRIQYQPGTPFPYSEIDRLVNSAFSEHEIVGYAIIGDPEDQPDLC